MVGRYFYGCTPTRSEVIFELPRDLLTATPRWEAGEPNPPLAVREAIRVGHRRLQELVEHEAEWVMLSAELAHADECDRWFYRLNYQLLRDRDGRSICILGQPYYLPIVVLMSGEVLEPFNGPRPGSVRPERWIGML